MFDSNKVRNQEVLSFKRFIVLAGAILLSMQASYADVIYRETYSRTAGAANTNFDYVGWAGYWSATAQPSDSPLYGPTNNNFAVGSSLGRPSGGTFTNVNAGPEDGNTNGFAFASGQLAVSNNILVYTSQYTVDPSVWNVGSISFYSGNTSNTFPNGMPGYRIAVQIDGNWYASSQLLVQNNNIANAAAFATSGQQLVFNWTTAASAWLSLSFTPGTTLALGGPVGSNIPSDPITAFGLYSDPAVNTNGVGGTATRRWDSYEIDGTAVPEPSSVMLVLIGLGTLVGFCRSRKA
jgi:PEP-CTERM motif